MITKLNWQRYEGSTSKVSTKELKATDYNNKGLHTEVKFRKLYQRLAQNNSPLIKASDLLTQEDINIDELQDLVSLSIELNTDLMAEINQKRRDNVVDNHRGLKKGLEGFFLAAPPPPLPQRTRENPPPRSNGYVDISPFY